MSIISINKEIQTIRTAKIDLSSATYTAQRAIKWGGIEELASAKKEIFEQLQAIDNNRKTTKEMVFSILKEKGMPLEVRGFGVFYLAVRAVHGAPLNANQEETAAVAVSKELNQKISEISAEDVDLSSLAGEQVDEFGYPV
jgi:hypothetical protein